MGGLESANWPLVDWPLSYAAQAAPSDSCTVLALGQAEELDDYLFGSLAFGN